MKTIEKIQKNKQTTSLLTRQKDNFELESIKFIIRILTECRFNKVDWSSFYEHFDYKTKRRYPILFDQNDVHLRANGHLTEEQKKGDCSFYIPSIFSCKDYKKEWEYVKSLLKDCIFYSFERREHFEICLVEDFETGKLHFDHELYGDLIKRFDSYKVYDGVFIGFKNVDVLLGDVNCSDFIDFVRYAFKNRPSR